MHLLKNQLQRPEKLTLIIIEYRYSDLYDFLQLQNTLHQLLFIPNRYKSSLM